MNAMICKWSFPRPEYSARIVYLEIRATILKGECPCLRVWICAARTDCFVLQVGVIVRVEITVRHIGMESSPRSHLFSPHKVRHTLVLRLQESSLFS